VGSEEREFEIELEADAWIAVRMRPDAAMGMNWAAVLCVRLEGEVRSVYIYDNAHGVPERHRVHRGVKLAGKCLPTKGGARLDLPAAIDEMKANWRRMVE
jgi:hypothetical protein